jgi:TrmH family RNA methyltransferase
MTKAELKYYSSLLKKKYRDEQNKFLVEGEKLILEAVNSNFECVNVICSKDFSVKNPEILKSLDKITGKIEIIPAGDFQKIQATVNSPGVIGAFTKRTKILSVGDLKDNLIVALNEINDPGNVGTILRNADWFGIREILLSSDCAEIYNPKTIRASAGSIFHLDIVESNNFIESLISLKSRGYKILCADITGTNIYRFKKRDKEVVVFSNEAKGPTRDLLKLADERITVPKKGKAESLNVASASAVILSEMKRSSG